MYIHIYLYIYAYNGSARASVDTLSTAIGGEPVRDNSVYSKHVDETHPYISLLSLFMQLSKYI